MRMSVASLYFVLSMPVLALAQNPPAPLEVPQIPDAQAPEEFFPDWTEDDGHGRDRVAIGDDVLIDSEEQVENVAAIGGNVVVKGIVRGDVAAIGGDVILKSGAVVEGNIAAVGGKVTVETGAAIGGDQVALLGGAQDFLQWAIRGLNVDSDTPDNPFRWVLWTTQFLTIWLLGSALLWLMPSRMRDARVYLKTRSFAALVLGTGLVIVFVPLCVLLAISILGLPLIPLVVLFYIALLFAGFVVVCTCFGHGVLGLATVREPRSVPALALGILVAFAISFIPWVGCPALLALSFAAAGALLIGQVQRASQ